MDRSKRCLRLIFLAPLLMATASCMWFPQLLVGIFSEPDGYDEFAELPPSEQRVAILTYPIETQIEFIEYEVVLHAPLDNYYAVLSHPETVIPYFAARLAELNIPFGEGAPPGSSSERDFIIEMCRDMAWSRYYNFKDDAEMAGRLRDAVKASPPGRERRSVATMVNDILGETIPAE